MMLTGTKIGWCLLITFLHCGAGPSSKEVQLYTRETWYQEAPSPELTYEGRLHFSVPTTGPDGRVLHVRLALEDSEHWIYDPNQKIPSAYDQQWVRIEGKIVTDSLSGIDHELWPGRMWVAKRDK